MRYKIQNQKLDVCGAADGETDTILDSEQNVRGNKTAKRRER